MVEEIAFENGSISNFRGLVTLTLDPGILYTIVHESFKLRFYISLDTQ